MKKLLLTAAIAAIAFGQDAKLDPKAAPPKVQTGPVERALTEIEVLRFQDTIKDFVILRKDYRIDEFQKAAEPITARQREIFNAACLSIGIAKEKIETECAFTPGIGSDGKPMVGPDGKPIQARVWRNPPVDKPAADNPTQAKK